MLPLHQMKFCSIFAQLVYNHPQLPRAVVAAVAVVSVVVEFVAAAVGDSLHLGADNGVFVPLPLVILSHYHTKIRQFNQYFLHNF